jgi:hypothetical protein
MLNKRNVKIGIYDVTGREVKELGITNYELGIKRGNKISLDVRDMRSGLYFVKVQSDEVICVGKIIRN